MKKRLLSILLVAAMLLSMVPAVFAEDTQTSAVNYVKNGSFEDDYLFVTPQNGEIVSDVAYEGSRSLKVTAADGADGFFGAVATPNMIPGRVYEISMMVKGDPVAISAQLNYFASGSGSGVGRGVETVELGTVGSTDTWQKLSYIAVQPSGTGGATGGTQMRFTCTGNGTFWVDDIQFTEVPALTYGANYMEKCADYNGSTFEATNQLYSGCSGDWAIVTDSANVYEGTGALKLGAGGEAVFRALAQDQATDDYQISMMVKGDAVTLNLKMKHYEGKGTSGSHLATEIVELGTVSSSTGWQKLTYALDLPDKTGGPGGGTVMTLSFTGEGTVYVDGMEFCAVTALKTAALENAILVANGKVEADYTADSWTAMQTALTAANAALTAAESQEAIDAAAKALNDAVAALEDAPVYGPIGENLLTNGSFEQVGANDMPIGLSDWYLTSANDHAWGVKAFLETDPANVADGNKALHLKSESGEMMKIGYSVQVEAGKTYIFSYQVKGTNGANMSARINGGFCGGVAANADTWSTYTYIYESAAAGTIGFEISAAWNAMDVYVDDMRVYEYGEIVEEPAPEEPVYGPMGKNYITNGSFENLSGNGMPVGLTELYNDGAAMNHAWGVKAFLENDSENVSHGNNSLHVVDDGKNLLRVGFDVSIEANKTYILTYKVKGTSEAPVGARINGAYICNVTPNPDEWTTYTHIFESGATTYTHFEFTNAWTNAIDVYVDDMRMYEYGLITDESEPPEEPEIPVVPDGSEAIIPEGENLVVNGSFEDLDGNGKPMGMKFGPGATDWGSKITLVTEEGFASKGDNALKIECEEDNGYAWVMLRANVTPNTKYVMMMDGRGTSNLNIGGKLEFWKDDSGNAETSYLGGEEPDTYVAVNPDSWTTMSYVFTTPVGCNVIEIAVRIPYASGTLYVDNVCVYRLANNFAENGSFENVEDGQAVGIKASDSWSGTNVSLDTTEENVKDGSYSLKLTADGDDRYWAMVPARGMTPGATYQISFWMKGDMKNNDGTPASVGYSPDLFVDNNGHGMDEYYAGKGPEGKFTVTEDWQYCVEYITLPSGVVALTLAMGGYSGTTGTVYIDDVRIVKYEEAAIGELINERIFYYPEDGTGYAEMIFSEGYHVADNYTVNAYLMDGETILAEELDVAVVDDYAIFNYDLSLLTEKEKAYTVKAEIVKDNGELVATLSEDIYVYDRPTHLNENGEFVNDNGTIFNAIFGGWWPAADEFEEELLLMKEAGVTAIQWSIPEDFDEAIRQLDIMEKLGMKAQVVMYWDMQPAGHPLRRQDKIEAMEAVKDHPAIYAWKVADEPNATATPPEGMTVRQLMADSYKFIRSVDMDHPVTYIEADYRHYADSDDYADIVMIDPYPGKNSYASYTGDRVADIVSKIERPVTMCLQGFNFDGVKPTAVELHSMSYQSYLAGARHTGWYGFYGAGSNNLETDPDLYPALNGFYKSGEWEILFKQYSSGKNDTVASQRESGVWYDVFELDGVLYAALQNRTYDDQTVTVALDATLADVEAIKWADDVAVDAAVVDGALVVTLTDAQAVLLKLIVAEEPEVPELNTEELQAAVDQANDLNPEDYTDESWAAVQEILDKIDGMTEENSTQDVVDAVTAELLEAIAALETKPEDPQPPVRPVIPVNPSVPVVPESSLKEEPVVVKFPFVDVPAAAWYYDEVKLAWEKGLIDGMTATKFDPDASLTVAQAIKLAAALHQMDNAGSVTLTNGTGNWYDTYVAYAVNKGIIDAKYAEYGYAMMNTEISRAEFVAIFHGAMDSYKAINEVADNAIPDVKMDHKYAAEIYEFYRAGILGGNDSKGTFLPEDTINRAEMTAILIRMFDASARKIFTLQ